MRIVASFLLALTITGSANAAERRILEPRDRPTTEQLIIKTLTAGEGGRRCQHVRMRNSFADMFPAFFIDEDGTRDPFEFRITLLYGNVIRASKLLPADHPSKCKTMGFVADMQTGQLDVGAYEHCEGDVELRYSDAFYFDPEKKQRMGREHKLAWDIRFRRLMWRSAEIAAMCPAAPARKRN